MANENDPNEMIVATGFFNGSSSSGTFDIVLKFKFPEEQLTNALQFLAGIGRRLKLIANVDGEIIKLGTFTINQLNVDRDANASIKFKSNKEMCFSNNFEKLMIEETPIVLKAKVVD